MELLDPTTRDRLDATHPEAAAELANLQVTLNGSDLDPVLLELCADYFATALTGASWQPKQPLTDSQTACIEVCQQFMVSVSSVNDEQMAGLAKHFSPDEIYNLMYAIYLIEAAQRLKLTLERVLQ